MGTALRSMKRILGMMAHTCKSTGRETEIEEFLNEDQVGYRGKHCLKVNWRIFLKCYSVSLEDFTAFASI